MNTMLTVASWNIAGGHTLRSLDHFDYNEQDIDYFAQQLSDVGADIICLQETHTNATTSVAKLLAAILGFEYVYEQVNSPSHIDTDCRLGNAIISRLELADYMSVTYPYPSFPLFFKDGRPAVVHDKGLQVAALNGVTIANTQMLPLPVFGASYNNGDGAKLARVIEKTQLEHLSQPLIFCGDFNVNDTNVIYPALHGQLQLQDALPDELTQPNKQGNKLTLDHILHSPGIQRISSRVVKTNTDHYLCVAEFQMK